MDVLHCRLEKTLPQFPIYVTFISAVQSSTFSFYISLYKVLYTYCIAYNTKYIMWVGRTFLIITYHFIMLMVGTVAFKPLDFIKIGSIFPELYCLL